MNEKGYKVEELVINILSKIFSKDLIVKNPKYEKSHGRQKEIADILVPLQDTVLVFQVKTRKEDNKFSKRNKISDNRIKKKSMCRLMGTVQHVWDQ